MINMYLYTYACMHIRMHVCMYVYMRAYARIHTYVCKCMCVGVLCVCEREYNVCKDMYRYTYVGIDIRT